LIINDNGELANARRQIRISQSRGGISYSDALQIDRDSFKLGIGSRDCFSDQAMTTIAFGRFVDPRGINFNEEMKRLDPTAPELRFVFGRGCGIIDVSHD
jgi:hypothetical protein